MNTIKVELSVEEARRLRDEWVLRASEHKEEAEILFKAVAAIDCQIDGQLLPQKPAKPA